MFGHKSARTGFDLGSSAIKLVRSEGGARIERITHVGIEPYDRMDSQSGAAAVRRLLERCKLARRNLGRVALSHPANLVSVVEATVPAMSSTELRQSLPFESRKHLFLDGMDNPRLDVQVLGPIESSTEQRVLFAAAGLKERDARLAILRAADVPVDVVDPEPLSLLNVLLHRIPIDGESALALLDIGHAHVGIQITHPAGGLLHRRLGAGVQGLPADRLAGFASDIARAVDETLFYYRGRNRREVKQIHICGGGALHPEVSRVLNERLSIEAVAFDPLPRLAPERLLGEWADLGPRLATACGLCHWWDEPRV